MIDLIFKTKTSFNSNLNELIPINNEYSFTGMKYAFGNLSKTNIFVGENNSGKSRFLRYLFQNDFYALSKENLEQLFRELRRHFSILETVDDQNSVSRFAYIYDETKNVRPYYMTAGNNFFAYLQKYASLKQQVNKYYFPTIRGVKDYKSILYTKLNEFSRSAKTIQSKDSINHFISLLNSEKTGLETFDIYREITHMNIFLTRILIS